MIFLLNVGSDQCNSVGLYCYEAEGGFCDKVRLTRFVRLSLFFLSIFGRSSLPRPGNIRILYLFGTLEDCERLFDNKYDCDSF
jgi:hypothetical protein